MDVSEEEELFMEALVDAYYEGKVSSEYVWYDDFTEALHVAFAYC